MSFFLVSTSVLCTSDCTVVEATTNALLCFCTASTLQQAQLMFHHQLWLAHQLTLWWIIKKSSKPMVSSLTLKISSDRFEFGRNGRHWTCCITLNSICNFKGANNPGVFLKVEKFTLCWLSWKFFPDNSRGWLGNLINVTSWGYMFINCY